MWIVLKMTLVVLISSDEGKSPIKFDLSPNLVTKLAISNSYFHMPYFIGNPPGFLTIYFIKIR